MRQTLAILALILTACGAAPAQASQQQQPQATQAKPTATTLPTATLDYVATADIAQAAARQAQQTSDAATRLLIDTTVTHEALALQLAVITQAAEQIANQQAAMTMEAGRYTATAYATSVPLTQTQQARNEVASGTERAMTITAPTQMVAMAKAQAQAETETAMRWLEAWIRLAVGAMILALGGAVIVLVWRSSQAMQEEPEPEPLAMIPFTHPAGPQSAMGGKRLRAELHCTNEQLLELAQGIKDGKTLAYGQWKSTQVERVLPTIRHYFDRHAYAYELPGKGGEMTMTEEGMKFIEDTLALGEPPLPHTCVGEGQ